ncbi:MAG: dihydrofolate reductase family protein [Synechococcales cyanobacterium]
MGQLKYYVAATLDGFIAHTDGSFDGFVWDDQMIADFLADLKQFGTVLMGRKTYEVGLKEGKTSPYPDMRQILFSTSMTSSPDPAVELVQDDVVQVVQSLKKESELDIWLCGGSQLASTLLKANLIDQVIVKLNPVIFGSGIPLFSLAVPMTGLQMFRQKSYPESGIVVIYYQVNVHI